MILKAAINAKWVKCLVSAPSVVDVSFDSIRFLMLKSFITSLIQLKCDSILVNATGFWTSPSLQSLETSLIPEANPNITSA